MQRTMHSISLVLFVTIVAALQTPGVAEGTPVARAYPAQARATPPAAGNACSLLKKEDAAAALGGTVNGPESKGPLPAGPGMTVSACEYKGSGLLSVHLNLMQLPADQAVIYKGFCAQKGKEGLTGLGEVACWYDNKHEELHVLKGTTLISIELRGKNNPTEAIKAVAKKVFDQLR